MQCSPNVIHSRAVDLDEVAARLHTVSNDARRSVRSPSPSPTPPLPTQEEQDLEDLQEEIEAYPALIEAGGRAPYPVHLLKDIFDHPQRYLADPNYRDIMMFWRSHIIGQEERTLLCSGLLSRWGAFRKVQRIIRKRKFKSEGTMIHAANWDTWETFVERFGPKEGEWGFSEYAKRMKKRLAKYGFTRPFQLKRDLFRQDTLTTWIEYLGYEYWFYDHYASYVKRFQRVHDKAWKKLVESGVLRPGETIEVVCDIDSVFNDAAENARAKRTVKSAAAAVLAAEEAFTKSRVSRGLPQADPRRLLAAQAALDTAKAAQDSLSRRSDAITDFAQQVKGYRNAQKDAEHHKLLLRWIQQQIPLLELESGFWKNNDADPARVANGESMDPTAATDVEKTHHYETRGHAMGAGGALPAERTVAELASQRYGKRKRSSGEAIQVHGQPKRLRSSGQSGAESSLEMGNSDPTRAACAAPEAATSWTAIPPEPNNRRVSLQGSLQLLRPLRRSARIAQQSKKAALSTQKPIASIERTKTAKKPPARTVKRSSAARQSQHIVAKTMSTSIVRNCGQQG